MKLSPPKETEQFFVWLKNESEKFWKSIKFWISININPKVYGFQIQKNTKWNPGLSNSDIEKFEKDLGFNFPEIYKLFLKTMNGTDKPAYYSYPRDLETIQEMIEWICESFEIKVKDMDGDKIPFIIPITQHRFLISDKTKRNPVLSMYGQDVIIYASSLKTFLINDIFYKHKQEDNLADISVDFWLRY
jgi:hypothetical protein